MTETISPNLRKPIHLLAFGFGSGLVPRAPGTAGTLAAIIPWLWLAQQSLWVYCSIVFIAILAGVVICDKASKDLGVHDHQGIVWDEFCGFWLTMVAVPVAWQWILTGFVLFRFFDISKPWPISRLDKSVYGGLGIMLDDLMAAIYAMLIMQTLLYFY